MFVDMKYTNKKLSSLSETELIHPAGVSMYEKLLRESCERHGFDLSKLKSMEARSSDDLVATELWFDCCLIINELAAELLKERKKKSRFLNELKETLRHQIKELSSKNFDEL